MKAERKRDIGRRWGAASVVVVGMAVGACAAPKQEPEVASAAPPPPIATPVSADFTPDATLSVCPRMTVSNKPTTNDAGLLLEYKPFVEPKPGVLIATAPTNGACFSSGFGQRRGKLHKGIDLQSKPPSMIVSAADGVIVQAKYRDDYGNMVVIDHGDGVYTRYAHLRAFEPGVEEGATVAFGAPLGIMGRTSKYNVALHLHYEILTGDIANPKGSFGLTPIDPFGAKKVARVE